MISMIAKMAWIRRQEQENSTCSDSECYEDLHAVGEDYLEAVLLLNRQKVTCAVLILLIFWRVQNLPLRIWLHVYVNVDF